MQTVVKKWFQDKGYGFLENGTGPDIMVRKNELIKCSFLKVGSIVEFECHSDDRGLIAKKVICFYFINKLVYFNLNQYGGM